MFNDGSGTRDTASSYAASMTRLPVDVLGELTPPVRPRPVAVRTLHEVQRHDPRPRLGHELASLGVAIVRSPSADLRPRLSTSSQVASRQLHRGPRAGESDGTLLAELDSAGERLDDSSPSLPPDLGRRDGRRRQAATSERRSSLGARRDTRSLPPSSRPCVDADELPRAVVLHHLVGAAARRTTVSLTITSLPSGAAFGLVHDAGVDDADDERRLASAVARRRT